MKKILSIAVVLILVAGAVVYLKPDWRDTVQRKSDEVMDEVQTTTMYKWQDADGQWQVSSEKPPAGTDYEVLEYHRDTNVMPKEALTGKPD